jgi:tRNA threonylcarbamoyl adenosine modification protein YjeE
MEALGRALGATAHAGDVIVLTGELGAGKTTLARGFAQALGVHTPVSSPTFIVARTHARTAEGQPPLVHIDAYRLGSVAELEDIDIDVPGSIVVAEWAAPYISALATSWVEIILTRPTGGLLTPDTLEEPRQVEITAHGPEAKRYQRYLDIVGAL